MRETAPQVHEPLKLLYANLLHNYNKCKTLDDSNLKYIDYEKVLAKQIELKSSNNEIYVLSTFPLIVIDYNYDKAMEILKLKLKNKHIIT